MHHHDELLRAFPTKGAASGCEGSRPVGASSHCFPVTQPRVTPYGQIRNLSKAQADRGVQEVADPARPVLCAAARFHRDQARRAVGEVLQKLRPCQLQAHKFARHDFNPRQLKHRFAVSAPTTALLVFILDPPVCLGRACSSHLALWMPSASGGGRRPYHFPSSPERTPRAFASWRIVTPWEGGCPLHRLRPHSCRTNRPLNVVVAARGRALSIDFR